MVGIPLRRLPSGRTSELTSARRAAAIVGCAALGLALAGPEWVPYRWSREDGPVEWAGFAAFAVGSVLAFAVAWRCRPDRRQALAALALAAALLFAAGEEISWGQRLFDVETPAVLVDGNQQDELNLHNLADLQHKAVVAQRALAGAGVLLPRFVCRRWAWAGFPFFVGYLAYRGGRVVAVLGDWAVADRNSEVAEVMLAVGLAALCAALAADVFGSGQAPSHRRRA